MGAVVSLEGDWHFEREEPLGTVHIFQKLNGQVTAELRVSSDQWDTITKDLTWEFKPPPEAVLSEDEKRELAELEGENGA
jgi:hypothetical protein